MTTPTTARPSATMSRHYAGQHHGSAGQRGVATTELALVIGLLLLLLYGLVGFGLLFWLQQKVEHIAGDSARHAVVATVSGHANPAQAGCDYVAHHVVADRLLASLGAGAVTCVPSAAGQACDDALPVQCVTITVTANVSAWPMLKPVRALIGAAGGDDAVGAVNTLSATAVVRIKGDVVS